MYIKEQVFSSSDQLFRLLVYKYKPYHLTNTSYPPPSSNAGIMQLSLTLPFALLLSLAIAAPLGSSDVAVDKRQPHGGPPGPPGPPGGGWHGDWNNDDKNKQNNQNSSSGNQGAGNPSNPGYDPSEGNGPGYPDNGGNAGDTDANGKCVPGLDGVATDGNSYWSDNCEGEAAVPGNGYGTGRV